MRFLFTTKKIINLEKINSLRYILTLPFLFQLTLIVGTIGYLSFKNGQRTVRDISEKLLSETSSRVEEKLENYTSSAVLINQLNYKAIESGELNLKDRKKLLKRFLNQIGSLSYISTIYWGNNSGEFYGAALFGSDTLLSDFSGKENNYREPFFDYIKKHYSMEKPRTYDVRTRNWYVRSVDKKR